MEFKQIQTIIKDFEKSSIRELELVVDGLTIRLSKNEALVMKENTIREVKNEVVHEVTTPTNEEELVKAPLVGTFYSAASPDAKPFVSVGDKVTKGDVLFIIEAMKIMNEITSAVDGVVEDIYVKNGDAVGFDQAILRIV